jgi:hypothetical protein
VLAHATSDQPARHRERLLACSERPVVHPRIPLVRARPGAAARAGTKSSARLHAKHSHVTALPQEPCPGPPGACYDASQPRRCEAGSGEPDGKGRTRIPFRHAPVPGWACYATAWACRHSRPAFEARRPLLRLLGVVGAQLRVEVRRNGHELEEVLGIAAVVVVPGNAHVSPRASPPRWPVALSIKAIGSSMDTGWVDVFGLNRKLWRPLRGCVTTRPPTRVCTVAAWLASDLRHRRTACHLPRRPPRPPLPGRARRAHQARGK